MHFITLLMGKLLFGEIVYNFVRITEEPLAGLRMNKLSKVYLQIVCNQF